MCPSGGRHNIKYLPHIREGKPRTADNIQPIFMIKKIYCFFCPLIIFCISAAAQQTIPDDANAFFLKAMSHINQKHVSWVKRTATDVNSRNLDVNTVNVLAKDYGKLSAMGDREIEAMAFLVLMQSSKDQQDDLKNITAQINDNNQKKEQLRQAQQELEKNKTNIAKTKLDSFRLITRPNGNSNTLAVVQPNKIQTTQPLTRTNVGINQNASLSDIKQVQDELKAKLDSINKLGEPMSLRLQMMMERRSKSIEALSNIMKKISSVAEGITQNLK